MTTTSRQCLDEPGTQAQASALVPVFTVMDDAREPFAAVIRTWTDAGLGQVDRAKGLDPWAPGDRGPADWRARVSAGRPTG